MFLFDFLTSFKIALFLGKAQSIKKKKKSDPVTFLSLLLCEISDKSNVGIQCLLGSTVPAPMSRKAWPCLGRRGHGWEGVAMVGKAWPWLGRHDRRNWGQWSHCIHTQETVNSKETEL